MCNEWAWASILIDILFETLEIINAIALAWGETHATSIFSDNNSAKQSHNQWHWHKRTNCELSRTYFTVWVEFRHENSCENNLWDSTAVNWQSIFEDVSKKFEKDSLSLFRRCVPFIARAHECVQHLNEMIWKPSRMKCTHNWTPLETCTQHKIRNFRLCCVLLRVELFFFNGIIVIRI